MRANNTSKGKENPAVPSSGRVDLCLVPTVLLGYWNLGKSLQIPFAFN